MGSRQIRQGEGGGRQAGLPLQRPQETQARVAGNNFTAEVTPHTALPHLLAHMQ